MKDLNYILNYYNFTVTVLTVGNKSWQEWVGSGLLENIEIMHLIISFKTEVHIKHPFSNTLSFRYFK